MAAISLPNGPPAPRENLANLVSPFIDPSLPLDRQYETYLDFRERLQNYKPSQQPVEQPQYKSPACSWSNRPTSSSPTTSPQHERLFPF